MSDPQINVLVVSVLFAVVLIFTYVWLRYSVAESKIDFLIMDEQRSRNRDGMGTLNIGPESRQALRSLVWHYSMLVKHQKCDPFEPSMKLLVFMALNHPEVYKNGGLLDKCWRLKVGVMDIRNYP